jgi:hypothetical protein
VVRHGDVEGDALAREGAPMHGFKQPE